MLHYFLAAVMSQHELVSNACSVFLWDCVPLMSQKRNKILRTQITRAVEKTRSLTLAFLDSLPCLRSPFALVFSEHSLSYLL